MTINVTEIDEYLKMSKIELEAEIAFRDYERHKALAKASREHLKEVRERYYAQKKLCPEYKTNSDLNQKLEVVKLWTATNG